MKPAMSSKEYDLLVAFMKTSDRYVEFGTGGSTFVASSHVKSWIISVDSSKEWLEKVDLACSGHVTEPELQFIDIGPIGDWGYPIDPSTKDRWPAYHTSLWDIPKSRTADLYLIDGRFRVACLAQTILHCDSDAIIGLHDFTSRSNYHCVREIAREIAVAEDMSFFQPRPLVRERAVELLNIFKHNPA